MCTLGPLTLAAIDLVSGELRHLGFGPGTEGGGELAVGAGRAGGGRVELAAKVRRRNTVRDV